MIDWTEGYVAEIGYTHGYYAELNPYRSALLLLNRGFAAPMTAVACELGFGQGVSINVHAAASPVAWYGTDFNPEHASSALALASVSRAELRLADQAFSEFCARPDLPEFDYIGLHGIWTWISEANRQIIVDFVRRKLKLGGVLYLSYNSMPGWASTVPLRLLMAEHAATMGAPGAGIVPRIESSIAFVDGLLKTNPAYFRVNPQVAERFAKLKGQNKQYIAHEYFNKEWQPMAFAEMARWLAPARLDYACSAHYLDHVPSLNLNARQREFLQEIPNPMLRETVHDFMINQQFRRDYWVKGAPRLSAFEQAEALRRQRLVMVQPRSEFTLKVAGVNGDAALSDQIYTPLVDLLADHKPRTLGEISLALKGVAITFPQLVQAATVLCGKGLVATAQDDKAIAKVKTRTDKLNAHLMLKARGSGSITALSSPVTGGGYTLNRVQLLILLALQSGRSGPEQCADFVWSLLSSQGQSIVKDGKTLGTPEDNRAELNAQAAQFIAHTVPVLRALGVC